MDLTEYKVKEFLGDALLKLAVGELIIKRTSVTKFQKAELIRRVTKLCCNDCLSVVAQQLGLQPHPEDDNRKDQSPLRPLKIYANAYEVMVYEIYEARGMEAVKEFIKDTLIKKSK